MLRSKELRVRAWNSLKGKYWMAFLAMLITGLIASVGAYIVSIGQAIAEIPQAVDPSQMDHTAMIGALVVYGIAIVALIVGGLYSVFVGNVIDAGCCGYFIKNTDSKPSIAEIFSTFKTRYGRNVGTLFVRDIKIILWTLLFIIPGFIKFFEYSIIPYILADDPEISSKEAFKKAKQMMKGNKWRLFKLDISFIGWYILCVLTLGIGTFFLLPYTCAATAEFYVELKNK